MGKRNGNRDTFFSSAHLEPIGLSFAKSSITRITYYPITSHQKVKNFYRESYDIVELIYARDAKFF
jgi:hypothetical protein